MRQRLYRLIKETVRFFYPKMTLEGLERLPQEGCVLVGNHSQLHGPVTAELFFPANHRTWCAMEMMNRALVPAYAYRDFWSAKPRWQRPFWKALAHLIAPLAELLFNEAGCIAVYRDLRVTETLRETRDALAAGQYVVIFPEKPEEYNEILHGFQEGFVDVARL
ncbi:MAG: 1-acyl-sn-glycerol-3-phosphate acyltransferase, partial [bacterium]